MDDHNPNEEGLGGVEPPIDLSSLQPVRIVVPKIARACVACTSSATEGRDLVCRRNPPQVTFLIVPGPVTMVPGPGGRAQPQQAMQAVPHTAFPVMRPDQWCGMFEQKR